MQGFLQHHEPHVLGTLSGFDRLRLRGTLRGLGDVRGMLSFLSVVSVLLKDFKGYVTGVTAQICSGIEAMAEKANRPYLFLQKSSVRKERIAKEIAQRDGVHQGLICILAAVEPCWSFQAHPNRQTKRLELRRDFTKCKHYYLYYDDSMFGFHHVRLQTWFPFDVRICLNGREWLSRQLDAAHIGYVRRENCFTQLEDVSAAQQLMDRQLRICWPKHLNRLQQQANPQFREIFGLTPIQYYWSVDESEWATDVMFDSPATLSALYPRLLQHGMQNLSSADVLRFLGRKIPGHGGVHGRFAGEVLSDLKSRPEGIRIKHQVNGNSIKMYNKQGSVLRVETTLNNPRDLTVFRPKEGDPKGPKEWRKLRKGVADIHRRAKVCQKANERYLETMGSVETTSTLGELTAPLSKPTQWNGKRVRALNLLSEADLKMLRAVSHGEFLISGLRNRDLRQHLYGDLPEDPLVRRRQSSAVSRVLRLLRAHGLLQKVPKTHRYQISAHGRILLNALFAAHAANPEKLHNAA